MSDGEGNGAIRTPGLFVMSFKKFPSALIKIVCFYTNVRFAVPKDMGELIARGGISRFSLVTQDYFRIVRKRWGNASL